MKKLMVLLAAALFAPGLPAAAVASTAHATRPAVLASTCGSEPGSQEIYYLADNDSFAGGFWLHAHAFNQPVTTITTGDQTWYTCNGQRWTNPAGQIVDVTEVNLVGGDSCLNWVPSSGFFYLDSCQAGNKDELFQFVNDGGCGTCDWLVAVQASDKARSDEYFTAYGFYNASPVIASGPGAGGLAKWGFDCAANCPSPTVPTQARLLPVLRHN